MKLTMSFLNQLKMLSDLIFMSLVYSIMIYYFHDSFDLKLIFLLLIPYFLIYFFLVLFLHFNYLNENKGVVFEVNKNEIFKEKGIEILKYNNKDICEISFYMNGVKNAGSGILAHKNYYYAKVKLLDESSFIITSLYSSKIDKILEENFKETKITKELVFYPMI